jgi:hypothetical protein
MESDVPYSNKGVELVGLGKRNRLLETAICWLNPDTAEGK